MAKCAALGWGGGTVDRMRWRELLAIGAAAAACLCGACAGPNGDLRVRLEAFDPATRVRAILTVAKRGDHSLIPALVDRLDDDDVAVRMYAILALEKLTRTRLGYAYAAPAPDRRQAVDRWRLYVRQSAAAEDPTPQFQGASTGG